MLVQEEEEEEELMLEQEEEALHRLTGVVFLMQHLESGLMAETAAALIRAISALAIIMRGSSRPAEAAAAATISVQAAVAAQECMVRRSQPPALLVVVVVAALVGTRVLATVGSTVKKVVMEGSNYGSIL